MSKQTTLHGQVKFKEITLDEDLAARILAIDSDGNLVDRPAIDGSGFISTALADGRIWIGNAGGVATAVDTAAVGDIDADSVAGLTIKAGTIVDADINGAAAIAYSKLSLASSIVNADISGSAAIAYSKLNLSNSVRNADILTTAAIARSKTATGTAYRILANNSSGVMSENAAITASRAVVSDANGQLTHSATTAAEIAFISGLNANLQNQLDNEVATKTVKAIVKSPTVAEHGYAITWDNSTGTWDLTDPVTQGIPLGGDTRQVLLKIDGTDWNAGWDSIVLTDVSDVSALAADLNLLAGADAAGLTSTHLSYLIGASSNLQTQLGNKLGTGLAQNAIFVGGASNTATQLAAGTDGQVLTVVSGVPQWQTLSTSGSPGGSTTEVQYNNGGVFAGDSAFTWDATNNALTVGTSRIHDTGGSSDVTQGFFAGRSAGNFTGTGLGNIGIGASALTAFTTGTGNVGIGRIALSALTTGDANTAIGQGAMGALTTGTNNVGVGAGSLPSITSGTSNTGVGTASLSTLTTGVQNTALGMYAGQGVTDAIGSVFVGYKAGNAVTDGDYNIAIGYHALNLATTAQENIAIGRLAGQKITTGNFNYVIGLDAGGEITTGVDNIVIGRIGAANMTTGFDNIIIGLNAGVTLTTGAKNIALGYNADVPSATANGQLSIQNIIYGTGNIEGGSAISEGNVGIGIRTPLARFHTHANTLGDAVFRYSSPATNDDPTVTIYQNRVTTTDDTVTTIHTLAIPASTTTYIEYTVIARRTGGAAGTDEDGAVYVYSEVWKNVGGTPTRIGVRISPFNQESQSGWGVTTTASGSNVLIQVQGAVDNNITWHLSELKVMEVSS